jgi:hypothetical protein
MINWELEVEEDVACPADDMKTTDCLCSFVQKEEMREGRREDNGPDAQGVWNN